MGYNESDTCWHLMVLTEGGSVSMLKNLDAPTARQAYQRLQSDTHPRRYLNQPENDFGIMGWSGGFSSVRDSDIRNVEILGPDGCELDPWRGVEPYYYDLTRRSPHTGLPMRLDPEEGRRLAAEQAAAECPPRSTTAREDHP